MSKRIRWVVFVVLGVVVCGIIFFPSIRKKMQAGDEIPSAYNNNLDGEIIPGNKFIWNGTDMTSITHGIFTGFNINARIKYNYCDKIPMGIIRKSNGMTDSLRYSSSNLSLSKPD